MVGITRMRRCGRCKNSRIKCAEDWPTCFTCKRGVLLWPLPLLDTQKSMSDTKTEFQASTVTTLSNSKARAFRVVLTIGGRDLEIRRVRTRFTYDGSVLAFSRFAQVITSSPRLLPTSDAERLAKIVVHELETSNEKANDFLTGSGLGYWGFMPSRLEQSRALRDCVDLFFTAWSRFQRGLPCLEVADPRLYVKALRSLHSTIDTEQPADTNLLAALTIMDRYEHMFDHSRPELWSVHKTAISTVIRLKGSPELGDELDIILFMENYTQLVTYWLVEEEDDAEDFYRTDWRTKLENSIRRLPNPMKLQRSLASIQCYLCDWAAVVHELRDICREPWDDAVAGRAEHLLQLISTVSMDLDDAGDHVMDNAIARGAIKVLDDKDSPVWQKYEFSHLGAARFVELYATQRIVMNRMLKTVYLLLGEKIPYHLEEEIECFSKMIWMSLPYIRSASLMVAILYTDSFYVAYEASTGDVREYLLDWYKEIVEYQGEMPFDRDDIDDHLRESVLVMTGREDFIEPLKK